MTATSVGDTEATSAVDETMMITITETVRRTGADIDTTTIENEVGIAMMEIETDATKTQIEAATAPRTTSSSLSATRTGLRPREPHRSARRHGTGSGARHDGDEVGNSTQTNTIAGGPYQNQNMIAAAPYENGGAYMTQRPGPQQIAPPNPHQDATRNPYPYQDANPYPYQDTNRYHTPSRAPTPIIPDIVTPGAAAALNGWEAHTQWGQGNQFSGWQQGTQPQTRGDDIYGYGQHQSTPYRGAPTGTRVRNSPFHY
ncbi:hypothetical protein BDZ89DRAFT_1118403 [Hymenopellis radicata]|nr:hypothetical protein BDZ89DRAFT_1118403 [Hymenopellis radicata]